MLINCQTSTVQPLKFGNGYVISSHTLLGMWLHIHFSSIAKLQQFNHWSLGMDTLFHPTHYWACDYIFIYHQLPNFNGSTVEVWEWIRYFIPHITGLVITYSFAFTLLLVYVVLPHPLTHKNIRLTHWGRDKMDAISQTTFWRAFSSMKIVECWIDFHWSMFVKVQLTIIRHLVQIMAWRRSGDKPLSLTNDG